MLTTAAIARIARRQLLRRPEPPLESMATRSWEVAPGESGKAPPAIFLPGQLERITGWDFTDTNPSTELLGGVEVHHRPTRAHLIEGAWLLDGTLSKGAACTYLQQRTTRWPRLRVATEIDHGAIYCTPGGNRWFGQWLLDDCATYPLAVAEGTPLTTQRPLSPHAKVYEDWLGMHPTRLDNAFLHQVVIFDDVGQHQHKRERFATMKRTLLGHLTPAPHAGVFLLRGTAGERRVLRNEAEIAEHLRTRRGFRVIDPLAVALPELLQTCAGARVVCGVEGSHLIHGALVQEAGSTLLTLQPPTRVVTVFKHVADRDGVRFALVIGRAEGADFVIDIDEVERTLDLAAAVRS